MWIGHVPSGNIRGLIKKCPCGSGGSLERKKSTGAKSQEGGFYILKLIAMYLRSGHLQKAELPKGSAKLHLFSSKHSTNWSPATSFALHSFSNPDLRHLKSSGHSISLVIRSICLACSLVIFIYTSPEFQSGGRPDPVKYRRVLILLNV
jgi:hypothetical protein